MAKRAPASKQNWTSLKPHLVSFDNKGLLSLIHDLYDASKDNQAFLHARFGSGEEVLKPYKKIIDRWISPDPYGNQKVSVATATKAIADFKKAGGNAADLAELLVFYCECAAWFAKEVGWDDDPFMNALFSMFAEAVGVIQGLPDSDQQVLIDRLDDAALNADAIGYGLGDDMAALLAPWAPDDDTPLLPQDSE